MISMFWNWFSRVFTAAYVRHRCRALVKNAGFFREKNPDMWHCHHCSERLDSIFSERYIHSMTGETFRYPRFIATMCARCAWISDGEGKMPVWKWLELREKSSTGKKFFLQHERASLKMRLAEIEEELNPKPRLRFNEHLLTKRVLMLKNISLPEGAVED